MDGLGEEASRPRSDDGLLDALRRVGALLRRGWAPLTLFAVTFGVLFIAVFVAEGLVLVEVFKAQADHLVKDGTITYDGVQRLARQTVVVTIVLLGIMATAGVAGIVHVADGVQAGARPPIHRALLRGFRRLPMLVATGLLVLVGFVVLVAATPWIVVFSLLGLLVTPLVRRLQRRRPNLRWPSVRTLVITAIPFSVAGRWLVSSAFIVPAGVATTGGPRRILASSTEAVRGRIGTVAGALVLAALAGMAVQLLAGEVARLADDSDLQLVVRALGGMIWLVVLAAAIAVLYRQASPPWSADDLPFATDPALGGRGPSGFLMAMLALGALSLPYLQVPVAGAAPLVPGIVVTSLGDGGDANLGDGICAAATAAPNCTLRAAIQTANAGPSMDVIGFSVNGTIPLGSELQVSNPITIDGAGQRVVLDGGGDARILRFQAAGEGGGLSWTLRNLTLTNGFSDQEPFAGGAINSGFPGTVDSVTFLGNTASVGAGGAISAFNSLTVLNSTFVDNEAAPSGGGADIHGTGQIAVSQSTFVGAIGGSSLLSGFNFQVDDSIIAPAQATGCSLFDSFSTFSGTGNLITDGTCTIPAANTSPAALSLGPLGDNTGSVPTVSLRPNSAAIGAALACPALDARGRPRPATGCDVGAVEYDPATTTSLTATPPTSVPGDIVTLQAAVDLTYEPATPSGTVTFKDGTTTLGTAPVDENGTASLTLQGATALTAGAHSLTAAYGGSATATTSSGALTYTVSSGSVTVGLASSANPSVLGASVTFTATLGLPAPGTPTGSVLFKDGSSTIGTVTLSGAGTSAAFTTSSLGRGLHPITAVYSGDANYGTGTSAVVQQSVRATTSITAETSATSIVFGNEVTITAQVTATGAPTPTIGSVTFSSSPVSATVALDANGKATFTTDDLPVGTDTMSVSYAGTTSYSPSNATPLTITVTGAATTTDLVVTPSSPTVRGNPVTLTATVDAATSAATPTGAVQLRDGATPLGTSALDAAGHASLATSSLAGGSHSLTAVYVPAAGFAASTSSAVTHVVTTGDTSVTVTSDDASSVSGQAVTFTATVTSTGGGATPTGSVEFRDGTTVLGSAPLGVGGTTTFTRSSLAIGNHSITARYLGAVDLDPSTSAALTQVVAKAVTTLELAANPSAPQHGATVTFTATVAVVAPGSGVPTGTITFTDGATAIGTAVLAANGTAVLSVPLLGVRTHQIHAAFAGDGQLVASGATLPVGVVKASGTMVTTVSPSISSTFGQPVTITVTVAASTGAPVNGTALISDLANSFSTSVPVVNGVATYVTKSLSVGTHVVRALLTSDDVTAPGASAVSHRVDQATPTMTFTAVPNPSDPRLAVLTATVSGPSGAPAPTGSVSFYDGETLLSVEQGPGPYTTTKALSIGQHSLRASYSGNASYLPLVVAAQFTLGRFASTLQLSSTPAAPHRNEPITLTARVVPAAGAPTPTGTVRFSAPNRPDLGTGTLDGEGRTTLSIPAGFAVGNVTIHAVYDGDVSVDAAAADLPLTITIPPTVTVVRGSVTEALVKQPVVYTVEVTNIGGPDRPNGTISLFVDEVLVGNVGGIASPTVSNQIAATITTSAATAGIHVVRASFTAGNNDMTTSAGTTFLTTRRYATRTTLDADKTTVASGGEVRFSPATLSDEPAGAPPITFTNTVSVGDGSQTCTAIQLASCTIRFDTVGTHVVTASSPQTDLGSSSQSPPITITVVKATPLILGAAISGIGDRGVITGETAHVSWTIVGPPTGNVQATTATGRVICTAPIGDNGCDGSFVLAERATAAAITVRYVGNAEWNAAQTVITSFIRGCFRLRADVNSSERGTVTLSAPDCANGTGNLENSIVTVTATAADGFTLESFQPAGDVSTDFQNPTIGKFLVASNGATLNGIRAVFGYTCFAFNVESTGPVQFGVFGSQECAQQPGPTGPSSFVTWHRQGVTADVGIFGTGNAVAYDLRGAPEGTVLGQSTYHLPYTMTQDRSLFVRYDAPCLRLAITANGGSVATSPPTHCGDPFGRAGYRSGTPIKVTATPAARSEFERWSSSAGLPDGFGTGTTATASFTITRATDLTAVFRGCHLVTATQKGFPEDGTVKIVTPSNCANAPGYYEQGTDVTVAWHSERYFGGWEADQPVSGTGAPAGPSDGTGVFRVAAKDISVVALFRDYRACSTLVTRVEPANLGYAVTPTANDLRADYPCGNGSYSLNSVVGPKVHRCFTEWAKTQDEADKAEPSKRAALRRAADAAFESCGPAQGRPHFEEPGTSVRRYTQKDVTFGTSPASTATSGPLIGWTYATSSPPWANEPSEQREYEGLPELRTKARTTEQDDLSEVAVVGDTFDLDIYGPTLVTAHLCQKLIASVTFSYPDSSANKTSAVRQINGAFLDVAPVPNCPGVEGAWLVGTKLTITNIANKDAFSLQEWSRNATGADHEIAITLDGKSKSVEVRAEMDVVCHKLTIESDVAIAKNPAPNCPNKAAGDWYTGDTVVALQAPNRGTGYEFKGWSGTEKTGNPTFVRMDQDRTAKVTWRKKGDAEAAVAGAVDAVSGAFTTVADFVTKDVADFFVSLEEQAKIATAVMAKGTQYILEAPIDIALLPAAVLSLINLGLDDPDLEAFIDDYKETVSAVNIGSVLIGCTADSVLGIVDDPEEEPGDDDLAFDGTQDAAAVAEQLAEIGKLTKTAETLGNVGTVAQYASLGYGVAMSIADGNIRTSGPELQRRIKACIERAMPDKVFAAAAAAGS